MYEIFISLLLGSSKDFFIKLIVIPLVSLLLVFVVQAIWMKFDKGKLPYIMHSKIALLNSIIVVAVIINLYWFVLIKFNGLYVFTWNLFQYKVTNIYLLLSPLFVSYLMLVVLYFSTQSKIKKLI
jgi:hypothetical protein